MGTKSKNGMSHMQVCKPNNSVAALALGYEKGTQADRTCRQRRVKCDEGKPECRRCVALKVECRYSLVPAARPSNSGVLPFTGLGYPPVQPVFPPGVETGGCEVAMFIIFATETVNRVSCTFNREFWVTDVPRAAHDYPPLWHACLALASLQQRSKSRIECGNDAPSVFSLAKARDYYVFALDQFNKSIACLAACLRKGAAMTHEDKELVMLTNVVYIGICNVIGDTMQTLSHIKNTIELISHLHFGMDENNQPVTRSLGPLRYTELLAVLAYIDGQSGDFDEVEDRFERDYVLQIPEHETFSTMTEAYLGFLVIMYDGLKPLNYADLFTSRERIAVLKDRMDEYKVRLTEYEQRRLRTGLAKDEAMAIAEIRLYLRYFEIYFLVWSNSTRAGWMESEFLFEEFLDDVDALMATRMPYNRFNGMIPTEEHADDEVPEAMRTRVHSFSFCVTPASMLHEVARVAWTPRVRFKAQALMKKYPFKEGCLDSDYLIARYDGFTHFMLRGPERTLSRQRQGCPAHRSMEDTAMTPEGPFDGCKGCECLNGEYICRDHRVHTFTVETIEGDQYFRVRSLYDERYGLDGEVFHYAGIAGEEVEGQD